MARYMVIETFFDNCTGAVYERFHDKGRMLPEGLNYLDSWLARDGARCFQLMETDRFELFREWTEKWDDLAQFEIIEIGNKPGKTATNRSPGDQALRIDMVDLVLESTITCPNCGHAKTETMPTDACQYYYECEACNSLLKPDRGDCCVFCSFGTVKCPPAQGGATCRG